MRDGRAAPRITRRTAEQQPAGLRAAEVRVRGVLPGEAHAATWPAEIAVTIVDDWHGRGLGTELLTRPSGRTRCEGIHRLTALVTEDNTAMAGLLLTMSARSRRHCRAQGPDRRHRYPPGRLAKIPPLWAPSGDARGKRRLVPSSQNIPSQTRGKQCVHTGPRAPRLTARTATPPTPSPFTPSRGGACYATA